MQNASKQENHNNKDEDPKFPRTSIIVLLYYYTHLNKSHLNSNDSNKTNVKINKTKNVGNSCIAV